MYAVFVEKQTFYVINFFIKLGNTKAIRACGLCLVHSSEDPATVSLMLAKFSSQNYPHNSVVVFWMVKSQGQEEVGF